LVHPVIVRQSANQSPNQSIKQKITVYNWRLSRSWWQKLRDLIAYVVLTHSETHAMQRMQQTKRTHDS